MNRRTGQMKRVAEHARFGFATRWDLMLTCLKILAVVLLIVAAPRAWTDMFSHAFDKFVITQRPIYAVGYAVIFWAAIVSMALIPFIHSASIRIPLAVVVVAGYAADQM